jgi:ABC-2 type transport system ATP-binding protein
LSGAARTLWSRTLLVCGAASAGVLLGGGRAPSLPLAFSLSAALATAAVLYAALAHRRPSVSIALERRVAFAAKALYLALHSAAEEVLWRWFVLGAIAVREGWLAALLLSSLAFAASHARGQGWQGFRVHALTGLAFGAIFLVTGRIAAAIVAHIAYNVLVAAGAETDVDRQPGNERAPRKATVPGPQQALVAELRGVHKQLGSTRALSDFSLQVHRGEILSLLGPNGAGKTTALSILLGLRRADAGLVALFGGAPHSRRSLQRIGVTPQDVAFPPTLTVREIVDFAAAHYPAPDPTAAILERFELDLLARKQCGGLSGGERRRLAVALAFTGRPEVVFLDEPTTGLDVEARRALWHEVRSFADAGGTVLLTTHYLEEADALADRIVVVNHGTVAAEGTVAEVKAQAGKARVVLAEAPRLALLEPGDEVLPSSGRFECLVADPAAFVRRMVEGGASIEGLQVAPVGLEEAFVRLTKDPG